jgi:Zn-dependent protease with chaperone function
VDAGEELDDTSATPENARRLQEVTTEARGALSVPDSVKAQVRRFSGPTGVARLEWPRDSPAPIVIVDPAPLRRLSRASLRIVVAHELGHLPHNRQTTRVFALAALLELALLICVGIFAPWPIFFSLLALLVVLSFLGWKAQFRSNEYEADSVAQWAFPDDAVAALKEQIEYERWATDAEYLLTTRWRIEQGRGPGRRLREPRFYWLSTHPSLEARLRRAEAASMRR